MELFYFIPFGTKWLQTAPGAGGEAVPNGADMMLIERWLWEAEDR
jgi:hypothetical protein